MFAPAVVEAHAAMAASDLPSLSNHPIIEYFVGLLILLVGLGMWWKGERNKGPRATGGVEMHFDGPLVELLKEMKRVADAAEQAPEAARLIMAMRENIRTELERIERELRANIDAVGKEIDVSRHRIMDDLQKRIIPSFEEDLRAQHERANGLDDRLRRVEQDTSWLKGQREANPRTR